MRCGRATSCGSPSSSFTRRGCSLVNDYIVSETGKISVPDVGVIQAAGLTERQLEEQIKQILSPGVLRNPSVTVTLLDSQQRTFSILGNAVARPSRYVIPRYDFRLTDALATAGAQMQFNVSNIYVSRKGDSRGERRPAPTMQRQTPELNLTRAGIASRRQRPDRWTQDRRHRPGRPSVVRPPSSVVRRFRSLPSRPRSTSRSGRCSI